MTPAPAQCPALGAVGPIMRRMANTVVRSPRLARRDRGECDAWHFTQGDRTMVVNARAGRAQSCGGDKIMHADGPPQDQ